MGSTLWGGKVGRKVVPVGERCEGIEADSSAHCGVRWSSATNNDGLTFADQPFRLHAMMKPPKLRDFLSDYGKLSMQS
jgi:hypothetical protein